MWFRLLGEVTLRAGDHTTNLGTPRQQAVLAALLVDAGRPVPTATLVERVWGDAPPAQAHNVLYSHMSRIRRTIRHAADHTREAAPLLERRYAGYVLDPGPASIDLYRFRQLVATGRDPALADGTRLAALAEALRLWHGNPLGAITGQWAEQVRVGLHQQRLLAAIHWARLELRAGHTDAVIGAVPDLITEYPLVEPLHGMLMRALHGSGRAAEAIGCYHTLRRRLADDLGADPGGELRGLHLAILRGDRSLEPA